MNENVLVVIRAFGSEKQAANVCPVVGAKIRSKGQGRGLGTGKGRGPIGIPIAEKKKAKQAVIEKVSGVSTSTAVVDVDVERVDRTTIDEINAALENCPEPTEKRAARPLVAALKQLLGSRSLIGQTTAGVGRPIARRIGAMGKLPTFDPAMLMGKAMPQRVAGGAKGSIQNLLKGVGESAARVGSGAAGTSGKASLLGAGTLGAGGLGISGLSGGPVDKTESDGAAKPKKDEKKEKDEKKPAEKEASTSAQDTKKDDEGDKAKPGVVKLESASDTPPKKVPVKKPEGESENEVEYDEKTALLKAAILSGMSASALPAMNAPAIKRLGRADGRTRYEYADPAVRKARTARMSAALINYLKSQPSTEVSPGQFRLKQPLRVSMPSAEAKQRLLSGATRKAAAEGDIPLLGSLGGRVLGGLGTAAGTLGMGGPGAKLEEWSKSPTGRNIAGGGTALLAAVLAALAGKKMLGEKPEEEEEDKWASFGVMLKASLSGMGQPEKPLKVSDELPRRDIGRGTRRQEVFDDLARWSLGAQL